MMMIKKMMCTLWLLKKRYSNINVLLLLLLSFLFVVVDVILYFIILHYCNSSCTFIFIRIITLSAHVLSITHTRAVKLRYDDTDAC